MKLKPKHVIVLCSALAGAACWLADGVLDALQGAGWSVLWRGENPSDLLVRTVNLLGFVILGLIASRYAERWLAAAGAVRTNEQRLKVTLASIADGVIATDGRGCITFMNAAAQCLTGWGEDSYGKPIQEAFNIVNGMTRQAAENPVHRVLREGTVVGLANHTVLISRQGTEYQIADAASPIIGPDGAMEGVVMVFRDVTEKYQQEERYRSLVELSPDGIYLQSNWRFLFVNSAGARMVGAEDPTQLVGRSVLDIVHAESREKARARIEELYAGKSVPRIEQRFLRLDGTALDVEVAAAPLTYNGQPAALIMARDIGDRKRADEALRESLRFSERVTNTMPDLLYIFDLDQRRNLYTNRELTTILGYTPRQVQAMGPEVMATLVHPDDLAAIARHHAGFATAADEEIRQIEYRMRHADGQWRWLHSRDTVFARDAQGRPTQILGSAQDVTELTAAVREARQERDFADRLFETAPTLALVVDMQGNTVRLNRFGQELTGYSQQELLGRNWFDAIYPHEIAETRKLLFRAVISGQTPQGMTSSIRSKDGREITVQWFNSMLNDSVGQPAGVLAIGHDITELRLREEQLRQAQKMETIGRLAGGFAHDFNNQLTVVKGYCELLLRNPSADEALRGPMEEIHRASLRAAALTTKLLAFSRQQILRPSVVDLNGVLSEMADPLRRVIGEDIELKTSGPHDLARVRIDVGQLEQALFNLAINSRDAMPMGGRLTIETANVELDGEYADRHVDVRPGAYVMIAVTDTGAGMSAETQKHVFDPFFTTKPVGKGTGLGLPMVYGFVKQSGGHITFYSELGRGTTFKIYLPRVELPLEQAPAAPPSRQPGGNETILVVEDAEQVRELVRRILEDLGYRVLTAGSPAQALELLAEPHAQTFDLLIADVVMPGMSGPDLARRLRTHRPGLSVLYISGYAGAAVVNHGMVEPGVPLLTKPFTPDALGKAVRQAMDNGN